MKIFLKKKKWEANEGFVPPKKYFVYNIMQIFEKNEIASWLGFEPKIRDTLEYLCVEIKWTQPDKIRPPIFNMG